MAVADNGTKGGDYAERLRTLSEVNWKKRLDVQRPYRWNLASLKLGKVLDVGCGIGRNPSNLSKESVGVDHNEAAIKQAREAGLRAYTVEDFKKQPEFKSKSFDSMLLAHVLDHMSTKEGKKIIKEYLPYVSNKIVVICPQERGFVTDETHVNFLDSEQIKNILEECGLTVVKKYSFPFPRKAGKVFAYNETVVVAKKQ